METGSDERLGSWPRIIAVGFLAALLWCGFSGVEAWPLTAWRLFSGTRGPTEIAWVATTVDNNGGERVIAFASLPSRFRNASHLMAGLKRATPAQQRATCSDWAEEMRRRGAEVRTVRVYRVVHTIPTPDRPSRDRPRELVFQCQDEFEL